MAWTLDQYGVFTEDIVIPLWIQNDPQRLVSGSSPESVFGFATNLQVGSASLRLMAANISGSVPKSQNGYGMRRVDPRTMQAKVGEGHECYVYDTPGWPPLAILKRLGLKRLGLVSSTRNPSGLEVCQVCISQRYIFHVWVLGL